MSGEPNAARFEPLELPLELPRSEPGDEIFKELDQAAAEWIDMLIAGLDSDDAELLSIVPTLAGGALIECQAAERGWAVELEGDGRAYVTAAADGSLIDAELDDGAEAAELLFSGAAR